MTRNVVLIGCCGCGKGMVVNALTKGFPNIHVVAMSSILGGGNPDGSPVLDSEVISKLNAHLLSIGLHRSSKKNFLLEGVGRSGEQMTQFVGFLKNHRRLDSTAFCKLNIGINDAFRRMWSRYLKNLQTGCLRKEENWDSRVTEENFRRRLVDWAKKREEIFKVLEKVPNLFNIDATQEPSAVVRDLLSQIGWETEVAMKGFLVQSINENESAEHSSVSAEVPSQGVFAGAS